MAYKHDKSASRIIFFSTGLGFGIGVGTLIGILTHNIRLWLPLGVAFGMSFGILFWFICGHKKDDSHETDTKN